MIFRSLPHFKGKRRIGQFLYRSSINNCHDLEIKARDNCRFLLPNLKEVISLDLFLDGIYEPEIHHFLLQRVPKGAVMLDIGANIGALSIPLIKKRADIKCFCVEASPYVFGYLQKNVQLNQLDSQITCINKAMAADGNQEMPFYSSPEHFGKGSLSPVFAQEGIMVKTTTVDQLMQQYNLATIDFMKVDIEGFEYLAFSGGQNLLQGNKAPDIVFEFVDWAEKNAGLSPGASQELLLSYGYSLYNIGRTGRLEPMKNKMESQSAMLFATKKTVL